MKHLGLTTSVLALGAQAALVPPSISIVDVEFWEGASPIMISQPKSSVYLDCTSCPVAVGNVNGHPEDWVYGEQTELLLEFNTHNDHIYFNGAPIYPPGLLNGPITAKQVATKKLWTHEKPLFDGPVMLSSSIEIHPHIEVDGINVDSELHATEQTVPMRRLSIDVLAVNHNLVRVDTVEVRFREDTLEIFDVTRSRNDMPADKGSFCSNVFCRFTEMIKSKMEKLRQIAANKLPMTHPGCSRKHGGLHSGPKLHGGLGKYAGKFDEEGHFKGFREGHTAHPHHHHHKGPHGENDKGGHRHHGHHHSMIHRVLHKIGRFFNHLVMPVLIGIAAGMSVCGIGMILGHAFFQLYTYARYGRAGYQHIDHIHKVYVLDDDEDHYPDFKDAVVVVDELPTYDEAAPAPPQLADEKTEQQ